MIFLFLLLYIDNLINLSSISLLIFTKEGKSELRANDAFIAKMSYCVIVSAKFLTFISMWRYFTLL